MALYEVREARCITQNHLAELLQVDQSAISKMEKRTDMYISTLTHFIEAMGGQLEIRAIFPEGEVKIKQFKELAAS
jgi:transcriptional regulator with XRE-family HTH domain